MVIEYKTKSIEKVCTNAHEATKKHGIKMAEKIHQRIGEIEAAESVEMMIQFRIGRCHLLTGDRKQQYAVDLIHPYRLVFEKKGDEIQIVKIIEIVDYH
ncbi:MAG: type II toxin-antitoxin system RelE/ParE family toxin [Lachnospiraceae bacterium]|nr:type II toxin-antitoxin system RelE/ParE family toxin [Lachnospiraceae bacterium]